jgi:hypothetical protein
MSAMETGKGSAHVTEGNTKGDGQPFGEPKTALLPNKGTQGQSSAKKTPE